MALKLIDARRGYFIYFYKSEKYFSCPHPPLLVNSGCGAIIVASVSVWIPLCFGENSSSLLTHIVEAKCNLCQNVRMYGFRERQKPHCLSSFSREGEREREEHNR